MEARPRSSLLERYRTRVLTDQMVFLGGCATGLLLTDPAAPEVRPTRDVDVITEVGSLAEYYRLADALRVAGFGLRDGKGLRDVLRDVGK